MTATIPHPIPGDPVATEKVILIHGTFSAANEDQGNDWWQVGSPTYEAIRKRLPEHIDLVAQGELFHWSGENHERARNKAAKELLKYLKPLEAEGTQYHLIGHSHGGSVIWAALRLATARRKQLAGLRSWATVGTPFLHHRSRSPWHSINLFYMLLAAMLLVPAINVFSTLATLPYNLYAGNLEDGLIMRHSTEAGIVNSVLRAPFVEFLRGCGVPFTELEHGYRIGSYDPDSGQTATEFLLMTGEGWLILATIAALGYLLLLLGSWFVAPVMETLRISWENRLERLAFQQYRNSWLALWTPEDEAINGLRATQELSVNFLGKLVPRERIFISDSLSLVSRPWFWMAAPLYNLFVRPALDSAIRDIVVRAAQGNNRPARGW